MLDTLFSNPLGAVNIGILVIAILIFLQRKQAEKQLGLFFAFVIFGFISLIVYFMQFKGWPYQTLGFHFGCLTAMVFLVKEYNHIFAKVKNALLMLLLLLNLTGISRTIFNENLLVRPPFQLPESHTTVVTKELSAPDDKVLFLSTDVPSVFPQMTYTERLGGCRFLTAFPIKFFTNGSPEGKVLPEWKKDDELYFSWIMQDISEQKPTLIFLDISPNSDSLSYLTRKDFFYFIPEYECLGQTDHFLIYCRSNEQLRNRIDILYQHQHILQVPGCSENAEEVFE